MSRRADRFNQNRLRSSNITVIISIALVLFLLGIFGMILINAKSYADYVKEQLKLEAFFVDKYDPRDKKVEEKLQKQFIDSLQKEPFIRSLKFIDKEQASVIAQNELGINDHAIFEENIYPASVVFSLKNSYVNPEVVDSIKQVISKHPMIDEVVNDDELMITVYNNINKITYYLVAFAALFLIIVVVLINNSIRLKIYSKRFTIKTQQMVGARRRFIMRPFLLEGSLLGLVSGVISLLLLGGLWYVFAQRVDYPLWNPQYIYLIAGMLLLGVVIAFVSTSFATWRYLNLKTDQLY